VTCSITQFVDIDDDGARFIVERSGDVFRVERDAAEMNVAGTPQHRRPIGRLTTALVALAPSREWPPECPRTDDADCDFAVANGIWRTKKTPLDCSSGV
jgi:hypothetical protein